MDNVMKKFYAFNTDNSKNAMNMNMNNDNINLKSSSMSKAPGQQVMLFNDKNIINQERIKMMEDKLLKFETKQNEEKNDLFNLIKSNIILNKSTSSNRTHNHTSLPQQYLPNIYENKTANRRKFQQESYEFTNTNM